MHLYGERLTDTKKAIVVQVDPDRLVPSQPGVEKDSVWQYAKTIHTLPESKYPLAVLSGGVIYLQDHRRAAAMLYAGQSTVSVRLLVREGNQYLGKRAARLKVRELGL
jgi:hypothetical protein